MALARWATVVAACIASCGCFFYDSRWGESTAEQKHEAARLRPASLESHSKDPNEAAMPHRVARVRACATPAYVAETLRWEERFDELLRQASSVLEPSLGLTLRSAGTRVWEPPHGEGSLESVIADLPACGGTDESSDGGDGGGWVVALVQSTPKVVTDFHTLGMGAYFSRYLVMRAPNDPSELDALTRSLPDLDDATRQKLYSDRKHHKVLTLFLHELGHTLGGMHRSARDTIMSPIYDASERGYDEATLGIFRITLPAKFEHASPYRELEAYLDRTKDGFIERERRAELDQIALRTSVDARVEARPSSNRATPGPASAPPLQRSLPAEPSSFETMSKAERQSFGAALALEPTDARSAWQIAQPLFESYPTVREVQELRCRLAKARKFYPAVIDAHCARLEALGPSPSRAKP